MAGPPTSQGGRHAWVLSHPPARSFMPSQGRLSRRIAHASRVKSPVPAPRPCRPLASRAPSGAQTPSRAGLRITLAPATSLPLLPPSLQPPWVPRKAGAGKGPFRHSKDPSMKHKHLKRSPRALLLLPALTRSEPCITCDPEARFLCGPRPQRLAPPCGSVPGSPSGPCCPPSGGDTSALASTSVTSTPPPPPSSGLWVASSVSFSGAGGAGGAALAYRPDAGSTPAPSARRTLGVLTSCGGRDRTTRGMAQNSRNVSLTVLEAGSARSGAGRAVLPEGAGPHVPGLADASLQSLPPPPQGSSESTFPLLGGHWMRPTHTTSS